MAKKTKEELEARTAAHKALPLAEQKVIDERAYQLREAFGAAADWEVWGNAMVPWDELPEPLRDNWRAVARTTLTEGMYT